MASTKRLFKGGCYTHGGITLAYITTNHPYDIPGVADAMRRAMAAPSDLYGEVKLKLHENEQSPKDQYFVIMPTAKHISRKHFEQLMRNLFPGCDWKTTWITNIGDDRLIIALFGRMLYEAE